MAASNSTADLELSAPSERTLERAAKREARAAKKAALPPKPERFSLVRTLTLADAFTLTNAAGGVLAVFMCLDFATTGSTLSLWTAFAAIAIAGVCDALDGLVARKTRKSLYGADLDSLADVLSFGLAPAALGYTLGMRTGLDMLALIFFVGCGVSRLARYNATADALSAGSDKVPYYEGTPITTSTVLVGLLAVAVGLGATGANLWFGAVELGPVVWHPLSAIFILSGIAMASARLRIPKP